ncbi:hypothetical protein OAP18_03670 [Gammaproteobacteria bacterium]|nr:hypothetical protein [Gammaproteobacteria bacterium]
MTSLKNTSIALFVLCSTLSGVVYGQNDSRAIPRMPSGHISFAGTLESVGNWNGPAGATLANGENPHRLNLESNLTIAEIPFQPWAAELWAERRAGIGKDDPHTRCKPSGGARMFHTPYGMEILDLEDLDEIIFVNIGAPHSWRQVYMDGREHPADLQASWYGHSVGHWEEDTLVIDSVGYNTSFWFSRSGYPHTEQLHLIERLSRPSFDRLKYEVTVDDPGAYTQAWTGGWYLPWIDGNEPFDYLCQENNLDPVRMIGEQ